MPVFRHNYWNALPKPSVLALFGTSSFILCVLVLLIHQSQKRQIEEAFSQRYRNLFTVVGDTIRQLESATELVAVNAVKHLYFVEKNKGIPSEDSLRIMKKDFNLSFFGAADREGNIIRDTENPKELRDKKIFDFCPRYRDLLFGKTVSEITPIIPSHPTGDAYKFVMIPNHDRSRILETGVHIRFLGEVLQKTLASDENLLSLGLYTPNGVSIGFRSSNPDAYFTSKQVPSEDLREGLRLHQDQRAVLVQRIATQWEDCCECVIKKLTNSDSKYYYLLRAEVGLQPLATSLDRLRLQLGLIFFIALGSALLLSRIVSRRLVSRLDVVSSGVRNIMSSGDLSLRLNMKDQDEIGDLSRHFDNMLSSLQVSQREKVESERLKSLGDLASQVSHDIRSPLAALEMGIRLLEGVPEDLRTLILGASKRISDISNTLLQQYREIVFGTKVTVVPGKGDESSGAYLLVSVLEVLVTEKRLQFRNNLELDLEIMRGPDDYGIFVNIQLNEFKRVLSNLINNAVEALEGSGRVTVALERSDELGSVRILVSDTGKGIPPEILERLTKKGETHGKSGGTGLGLYHASEAIRSMGGHLSIQSKLNVGTTVEIVLTKVDTPSWFVPELKLEKSDILVVLDDDQTIHRIWDRRFKDLALTGVRVQHFSNGKSLEAWFRERSDSEREHLVFAVDYELLGDQSTGLDWIRKLGIRGQSVLVTSRFEEQRVIEGCTALEVRMIPKGAAEFVPIRVS